MKLIDWARENGLSYTTAWRLFRSGQLPVRATQLATGTILVHPEKPADGAVALYARVSGSDQKQDLERQLERLSLYAVRQGLSVTKAVSEVGSGLNGHRNKLMQLLADPSVSAIVVEHRDRLARFGKLLGSIWSVVTPSSETAMSTGKTPMCAGKERQV